MPTSGQNLTPTVCRINAHECRVSADRIPALRTEFLALAEGWDSLADQIEALDRERVELLMEMIPTTTGH